MSNKCLDSREYNLRHALGEVLLYLTGYEKLPGWYPLDCLSLLQLGDKVMDLQDWACCAPKGPSWLTGIGIIEAAEKLVEESVANNNFKLNIVGQSSNGYDWWEKERKEVLPQFTDSKQIELQKLTSKIKTNAANYLAACDPTYLEDSKICWDRIQELNLIEEAEIILSLDLE